MSVDSRRFDEISRAHAVETLPFFFLFFQKTQGFADDLAGVAVAPRGNLAFDEVVAPAVERFRPDLVLVSAGFDAHEDDPLAQMRVTADGFRELSSRCAALAPRVAAVLEGGYNIATLPGLVSAALAGFSEKTTAG